MRDTLAPVLQNRVNAPFLHRHYYNIVTFSLLVADGVSIALAFWLAFRLRIAIPLPEAASNNLRFAELLPLLAFQLAAIIIAFFFGRMYHRRRTRIGSDEIATIFSGVSVGTLISIAITSLLFKTSSGAFDYSRGMVFYFWLLCILFVFLFRGIQARIQRNLQMRGFGRTRAVVVGSAEPMLAVLQRITQNQRLGYDVVGIVPYSISGHAQVITTARNLGNLEMLSDIIVRDHVDEVLIAMPEASDEDMMSIISKCDRSSISIKVYPGMFQIMAGQMTIGELGGLPLLNVRDINLRGWKLSLKRFMDMLGSAVLLITLSPFLMLVALLIKLDSPGPVFFIQKRMGVDGKVFPMMKFRTMRRDAEKLGTWTVKDDPRKTRLGSFLRGKNIDELPQLINVLMGDMSLVGPRPEQPAYVEEFRKKIPRYMERHREKSGLTGWAQVNGLRGDTSIEERTKYDLWYVENWSVLLDIQIILRTIIRMYSGKDDNAY
jgi:exopolysaccharide biosynthesis polyprenyl glycosylphosphotransferase